MGWPPMAPKNEGGPPLDFDGGKVSKSEIEQTPHEITIDGVIS